MLSSFSPVGSSKLKETVAEILPRTATPLQSSLVARHVTSASSPENEEVISSREIGRTPFTPLPVDRPTDDFKRLSISGRLSTGISPASDAKGDSESIRERFALSNVGSAVKSNGRLTDHTFLDLPQKPKVEIPPLQASSSSSSTSNYKAPLDHPASSAINQSKVMMPELIKSMVEKAISESLQELRNDVQNLHVDLIKQTLAQQTMLKQIMANLPESFKNLAEECKLLRDENEHLKARLAGKL